MKEPAQWLTRSSDTITYIARCYWHLLFALLYLVCLLCYHAPLTNSIPPESENNVLEKLESGASLGQGEGKIPWYEQPMSIVIAWTRCKEQFQKQLGLHDNGLKRRQVWKGVREREREGGITVAMCKRRKREGAMQLQKQQNIGYQCVH